jgi:hypothetical protein
VETQQSRARTQPQPCDPASLERGVRQLLADKVSGSLVGIWLLLPEHLRLGTWDLLCAWTGQGGARVEPRLALQLVHEAALGISNLRQQRSLAQKGFALAHGLPFLASDRAIHLLLGDHSVAQAQALQVALGKLRRASGHFASRLLALDPHRVRSYSKRHMRCHRQQSGARPVKVAQTFFVLDADTHQPVCFTTGTSARSVTQATPELLRLAADILQPQPGQTLVVADSEHFSAELLDQLYRDTRFDLLVPMPNQRSLREDLASILPEDFTPQWAGYATCKRPYQMSQAQTGPFVQFVQRWGERCQDWKFNAFLATRDRDEVAALTQDFPQRWHIEEFFNSNQDLGWQRAGTLNLHIRYGHMTLALLAQAVIHELRQRLGAPYAGWNASHLAQEVFRGLEGDVRVTGDTIIVTYYNAPNLDRLRGHYENLPAKLAAATIDPRVPWLYGFKLDFRFR